MALTDTTIKNAKPADKPYKMTDGRGLYLLVNKTGKYFRWDYRYGGKRKTYGSGRPDSSLIPEDANLEIKNLHVDLDKIYHKILEKPKRVIYTESDRGLDKLKEMAQERKFKYLKYKHVDIPISVWHSGVIRGIPKILRRIVYNYFDGRYTLASAED